MFLASSHNLIHNLTPGHIACLVLFSLFVLGIIISTIVFFIYRHHVKQISQIDQLIEEVYRHPIAKMLNRLETVNKANQNLLETELHAAFGKYLDILLNKTSQLVVDFDEYVEDRKIFKINHENIKKVREIKKDLEYLKNELDALANQINIFFNIEYSLRDIAISLHEQINLLENNYYDLQNTNGSALTLDQIYFDDRISSLFIDLSTFEDQIKNGSYQKATETLKLMTRSLNELNEMVSQYPIVNHYLKLQFQESLNRIYSELKSFETDENDTRLSELKRRATDYEQQATTALNNYEIKDAKEATDKMIQTIINYKSTLVYEEKIKSFMKNRLDYFKNLTKEIRLILDNLKKDNININKEIPNFKKNFLIPLENVDSEVSNYLSVLNYSKLKEDVKDNLASVYDNLKYLQLTKPKSAGMEDDYRKYIDADFAIKSLLRKDLNLIENGDWLKEEDKKAYLSDLKNYEELISRSEYSNLDDYKADMAITSKRKQLASNLSECYVNVNKLSSEIKYKYQLYRIASAIIPYVESREESDEIAAVLVQMINWFDQKDYEKIVNKFIERSNLFI
ncbi:septation ring formation regulator EzrA [Mesoplasma lactucae]|uniref:Uncharacterized protein n=1 Tax=Mesoplasma lactucae ATCC 49193 TaxID=81460 RepID=A0A291IS92_9MOLU|nr:septation ring formation regulator EzrA [Mesoplasma lactucae]ATG97561.1 hypothetical protein CP520_02225 [Mesoplasma lactucae ATCC 49193]ATZ19980.1 hypothetical protein MLACT_v1c01580 [Mesoplasma lactucae ATCC 49193]MCL8217069.1 hypothetical protein [Mesoplasma lactucae ATCC 49193]